MTFGAHVIATGDVLENLRALPDNSFDGLLCDPPYGFRFMGKKWDYDVPSVEVWREALRVLKPGAALLSFGGARTFHRIAIGIEDAGFELRDCLCWLYGKGFPKSLNVGLAIDKAAGAKRETIGEGAAHCAHIARGERCPGHGDVGRYGETVHTAKTAPATELAQQWDGYGTALKPAWEPVILARKPIEGTVAANVTKWGVGALAIDACRIDSEGRPKIIPGHKPGFADVGVSSGSTADGITHEGRWPANVAMDEDAAAILDAEVGNRPSRPSITRNGGGNAGGDVFTGRAGGKARPDSGYSDSGGPSRFFYCAKVSTKEREFGCDALAKRSAGEVTERAMSYGVYVEGDLASEHTTLEGAEAAYKILGGASNPLVGIAAIRPAGLDNPRAGAGRTGGARNHHPTLKPLSLTRWLASLIKPPTPGATLLVPYAGAGSEIIGALQAGWGAVFGIEGEADYVQIANARVDAWGKAA